MRKKQENINFLEVNKDERSSLFVLDLKESDEAGDVEKKETSREKYEKTLEKISEFSLKQKFVNIFDNFLMLKNKSIDFFSGIVKLKKFDKQALLKRVKKTSLSKSVALKKEKIIVKPEKQKRVNNSKKYLKKIDDLAFLSIFKVITILIYTVSYKIGLFLINGARIILSIFPAVPKKTAQSSALFSELKVKRKAIKQNFKDNVQFILDFFRANLKIEKKFKSKKTDKSAYIKTLTDKEGKFEFASSDLDEPIMDISFWRSALKFAIILFIIILPFKILSFKSVSVSDLKGRVLGATETAIDSLKQAGSNAAVMDFESANNNFSEASNNFLKAQDEIGEINDLFFSLLKVVPNEEARLASEGKKILEGGRIAAEMGSNMSMAMEAIFDNKDKNLIEIIDEFVKYGELSINNIDELNLVVADISIDNLPVEYREQFASIKEKSIVIEGGLREFIGLADELKIFLGAAYDKRYLLVFQNNTEMRASGGFIGSYALVDFSNGKLKNLEVPGGGSYDTEGGMKVLVQAPKPLHLVNSLWHFWDANWWPDWSKSAKKLMWFFEKSDGPTVDGVISFTPTVLEDILEIIGSIDMSEEHGVVLDSENFWITAQSIVENKETIYETIDGEVATNTPKKLIGDLMEKMIEELPDRLDKESFIKLFAALESNLSEKHILFYFEDEKLQSEIEEYGWDGGLKDFKWDYLSVVNTNIAGGKSDKMMKEDIKLESDILKDGSVINTLKIKRIHTGIKYELFTGVRNVNWLRVYVPLGSELIDAEGFAIPDDIYFDQVDESWQSDADVLEEEISIVEHGEDKTKIYNENGKTVFANWSMVDPGQTAEIVIRYKLPFVIEEKEIEENWVTNLEKLVNPGKVKLIPHAVYFQKQSGSIGSKLSYSLNLSDNFSLTTSYPKQEYVYENNFNLDSVLETDKYSAFLIKKKY